MEVLAHIRPRADICNPYLCMIKVNLSHLDHDVSIDDSCIFHNSDGEEVCYVFHKFCPNKKVLGTVNNIVKESVDICRNCRVSSIISIATHPF